MSNLQLAARAADAEALALLPFCRTDVCCVVSNQQSTRRLLICKGESRMVPPRLNVGASKYWLRARSGNSTGGKILVSVDSLYNIFKENRARTRRADNSTAAVPPTITAAAQNDQPGSPNMPAIRKSARLFEKRAALLRCTRGGPQYWLRTRSKGNKRSLLVSVKSLYPSGR